MTRLFASQLWSDHAARQAECHVPVSISRQPKWQLGLALREVWPPGTTFAILGTKATRRHAYRLRPTRGELPLPLHTLAALPRVVLLSTPAAQADEAACRRRVVEMGAAAPTRP